MTEEATLTEQVAEEIVEEATQEVVVETTAAETEVQVEATAGMTAGLVLPPPKKKTAQERIDEITRARRQAERDAEYWRGQALERERGVTKPEPVAEPGILSRPVINQFETTEAYEDALLAWHDGRRTAKTQAEENRQRNEDALQKFNERSKPLREQYEDFDEVIETPVFTPAMRMALLHSDNGPQVAYFLGRPENRTTAEHIKSMPVERQIYELGKLETNLLVTQKIKKVSSAPKPITPVGTAGGMITDESKLSDDDWYKLEKQRQMDKLKKKYGG